MSALLFDARMQHRVGKLPARYGEVVRAHSQAVRGYTPQRYPGHVTVFRAASQVLFSPHYPDLGWGWLAPSVSIYRVPGTHATLIVEPHVRALAGRLSACLLEAQATHPSMPADTGRSACAAAPETDGVAE